TIAQQQLNSDRRKRPELRCLKFMYTLSPDWIRELADSFIEYFKPHKQKTLHLYYDRAANNYKKAKQDLATQMKNAIEKDKDGKINGRKGVLMSDNQRNICMNAEYMFMQDIFSGNNPKLPKVRIDMYNGTHLKCSLEMAPTKKNAKGQIVNEKKSEQLQPI